jgi:DNA repair protein RadA/Sms
MTPEKHNVSIVTGNDLYFADELFIPMKTDCEMDGILSTEGGLMKATNVMFVGGAGSGKTTVTLDMLARLTMNGKKCLFVSGEMDEIAYYKYCKRLPLIKKVPVIFLRQHADNLKGVLEQVFNEGWDVIALDSMAEIISFYKEAYKTTEGVAENWLLDLQEKHKKGHNATKNYTTFINIQQVGKNGVFIGSNRLKHMTDAMAHLIKNDNTNERTIYFSKNRDCDVDYKVCFAISKDSVFYSYQNVNV